MQRNILLRILLVGALFSSLVTNAQDVLTKLMEGMSVRNVGPAATSGRVTAIDVIEGAHSSIWAGTASGGLWVSESGGVNWQPVFDKQEVLGIGAIKIDPSNPDVIWVGTGEGNPRNSQTSGMGIYRTTDGGNSWHHMGLSATKTIHRICIDPLDGNKVYVASPGSAWGPGVERGVYATTDGGKTWKKSLFVNDSTGCGDMVIDPRNPRKLFAAMWQYQRKPWVFNSGGNGSGLYVTTDGGENWKRLGEKEGLPGGKIGRIGVAIAPSNSKIVYALVECEKTGLYKSSDGGFHWELVSNEGVNDRPFYYHEFYVDPLNENHLIYIHSTVSESIDGGKSWTVLLPYYGVHPDHHAFWWSKTEPSFMIDGNDGGLNISRNAGKDWQFAGSIPVGQFYHVNYDMAIPYNVYGGLQDNGSWKGPSYVWHEGGIRSSDWQEILFGDGFDVVPSRVNADEAFCMSQGGEVYRVNTKTGAQLYCRPLHPDGTKLRFNWNSAIAADPFVSSGLYFGSQFVHYSNDEGLSWKIISPDLTSNDSLKMNKGKSGGLTNDVTSAENYCTIISIEPSSLDKSVVWAGTDDGNVQLTRDGGKTWEKSKVPMPSGAWVPQIVTNAYSVSEAFVVANNYRQNDWGSYVYFTNDFGRSWKRIVEDNQVKGHCLSIAQDPVERNLLFLGTEHGFYVSLDFGKNWKKWTSNYPAVATQDVKIHPREHDLILGTFGRSVFVIDDIRPLRILASNAKNIAERKLTAFEVSAAYQASVLRPLGERFPADGMFEGANKPVGTVLSFYINFPKKEKGDKKEESKKPNEHSKATEDWSKVYISIIDARGDTVRHLEHKPDTALNTVVWGFDSDGVLFPTRAAREKETAKPGGGIIVRPGNYKVVYRFGNEKDSTMAEVKADPRSSFNQEAYNTAAEVYKRWAKTVTRCNDGMERIKDMRKNLELMKSVWVNTPDSTKKNAIAFSDSISKKLDDLELLFLSPARKSGGIYDNSDYLISKMYNVLGYIDVSSGRCSAGAAIAEQLLEHDAEQALRQLNTFIAGDWKKWKELATNVPRELFPEVKPVD